MAEAAATTTSPPAPSGRDTVWLSIDRIAGCPLNPRISANPEFARIKASIGAEGLVQALTVTPAPGGGYRLYAGGHTRLRALRELYAETGDPRFAHAPCFVRDGRDDADLLLAHLKENELRADLSFLEKALAVAAARRMLAAEAGPLNQMALAQALRARGFAMHQGLISVLLYTAERLYPLIPQALAAGLGRPQISRIRALEKAAAGLWRDYGLGTQAEFESVFQALCERYDSPDWDLGSLRRALEAEIAEAAGLGIQAASMALQSALAPARLPVTERRDPVVPNHISAPENLSGDEGHGDKPADNEADVSCPGAVDNPDVRSASTQDINAWRERLGGLAMGLADRNGLADIVQALSGRGLGYLVVDVPAAGLIEQLDEAGLARVSMLWWQLAAGCELTVAPPAIILPLLPKGSVLHRALGEADPDLLFGRVWTLDPGHAGYRLWCRADEQDWSDLRALMDAYRKIHRAAKAQGVNLWSLP